MTTSIDFCVKRLTSDNPEATYDTLTKYGYDLVERAREQKLDPVIGRDNEIRNIVRILSRKTKNNPVLIGEPDFLTSLKKDALLIHIHLPSVLLRLLHKSK